MNNLSRANGMNRLNHLRDVTVIGENLYVSTKVISRYAGVRHSYLLRTISEIDLMKPSIKLGYPNWFIKGSYISSENGRRYPAFLVGTYGLEVLANKIKAVRVSGIKADFESIRLNSTIVEDETTKTDKSKPKQQKQQEMQKQQGEQEMQREKQEKQGPASDPVRDACLECLCIINSIRARLKQLATITASLYSMPAGATEDDLPVHLTASDLAETLGVNERRLFSFLIAKGFLKRDVATGQLIGTHWAAEKGFVGRRYPIGSSEFEAVFTKRGCQAVTSYLAESGIELVKPL